MDRSTYDRLRSIVDSATPDAKLASLGIAPDSWPRTLAFNENCNILGAEIYTGPIDLLAREYGWSDPDEIDHVAVAKTPTRDFVVVQQHPDNTPDVSVYVYRTDDSASGTDWPTCWTTDALSVRSTS
jgi:hypothetical protein